MKYLALPLILLLSACSSTNNLSSSYFMKDMLDTAPKSDADVRHPEWGYPSKRLTTGVQSPAMYRTPSMDHTPTQARPNAAPAPAPASRGVNSDSLQNFLLQNGVDYEVLPGNHIMVKLKNTVRFDTGSSTVKSESRHWLDIIGRYLSSQPDVNVVIDGHSDSTGTTAFNDGLSVRRANAVKQQLIRNHVNKNTIFTRGYGENVPTCTNATTAGKACNRRVELVFIVSDS